MEVDYGLKVVLAETEVDLECLLAVEFFVARGGTEMVLADGSPKLTCTIFVLDGLIVLPLFNLVFAGWGAKVP